MNQQQLHGHDMDIDPEIVELLEPLCAVPKRDPRAVESGRSRFLTQLDALELPQAQNSLDRNLFTRLFLRHKKTEGTPMNAPRFAFSAFTVAVVVLVVLFGGAGTTVYASQSALPGDALYSIKTGYEHTQASLTVDAVRRAELYLEFASHRLDEAERLIEQGRYDSIQTAMADYERYVGLAVQELDTISQGDPARAAELSREIVQALARYKETLFGIMDRSPEQVRERVNSAIRVSNPMFLENETEFSGVVEAMSSTSWTVGGTVVAVTAQTQIKGNISAGDTVRVHAYTTADGSLTAREIEQVAPGGPGFGEPQHTRTPQPTGSHTPGTGDQDRIREQEQDQLKTHTPETGVHDQIREQEQDQLRTHTPEPVDAHNGDGSQNGAPGSGGDHDGTGEAGSGGCTDCSGSGSGSDGSGQQDGSSGGNHDGGQDGGGHDGGGHD